MSRILIDQEGMRGAANELRAIDAELDALRGRMRGAAIGAMPPAVIARIGATTARADLVLHGHGERLRVEAGRLEWRATAAELAGGRNPAMRGSFDFLDRSGLLGLASFVNLVPNVGRLRVANDALGAYSGRVGQLGGLYLDADELRRHWVGAGKHGLIGRWSDYGRRWTPVAQKAKHMSGRIGNVSAGIGGAFSALDVFSERTRRGQHPAHAAAAGVAIGTAKTAGTHVGGAIGSHVGMAAGAALGSAFGPVGTLVGAAAGRMVGGAVGGWVGGVVGEKLGEWGVAGAEKAVGSVFRGGEGLANDAGRAAGDVANRAGDAIQDVGNAVKDKLKFW